MYRDTHSSKCQMSNYLEVQEVQKVMARLWEEAQIAAAFAEAGGWQYHAPRVTTIPTQESCLVTAAGADVADVRRYRWMWSLPLSLLACQLQAKWNYVMPSVMQYAKYWKTSTCAVCSSVTLVAMTAVSQMNSPSSEANSCGLIFFWYICSLGSLASVTDGS